MYRRGCTSKKALFFVDFHAFSWKWEGIKYSYRISNYYFTALTDCGTIMGEILTKMEIRHLDCCKEFRLCIHRDVDKSNESHSLDLTATEGIIWLLLPRHTIYSNYPRTNSREIAIKWWYLISIFNSDFPLPTKLINKTLSVCKPFSILNYLIFNKQLELRVTDLSLNWHS